MYQWLRLNFGDKPAPDIATNAINTLAKLSQAEFPEAAKEVQDHMTTSRRFKCVPQILGSLSIHIFTLLFLLITYS